MHTLRVLSYIAKSPNWKALPVYVLSKGESICLSSFSLSQGIIIKKKKNCCCWGLGGWKELHDLTAPWTPQNSSGRKSLGIGDSESPGGGSGGSNHIQMNAFNTHRWQWLGGSLSIRVNIYIIKRQLLPSELMLSRGVSTGSTATRRRAPWWPMGRKRHAAFLKASSFLYFLLILAGPWKKSPWLSNKEIQWTPQTLLGKRLNFIWVPFEKSRHIKVWHKWRR